MCTSHCGPPGSNLAVHVNRAIDDRPGIQQWFKQRLILSVSKPSISQWSQIKEYTVEPSVPAREFNLKAYAAITWHNDLASLGLEPRLADDRSQAACTATLPTAPPGQAIEGLVHIILRARPVCWVSLRPCTAYSAGAGLICYPNTGSH